MFCTLSAGLSVDPLLYRRQSKTPELADVNAVNLALTRKSLKGLGVNLNDSRSLLRVEEPLRNIISRLWRLPFGQVLICHWLTPGVLLLLSGHARDSKNGLLRTVRPILISYVPIGGAYATEMYK